MAKSLEAQQLQRKRTDAAQELAVPVGIITPEQFHEEMWQSVVRAVPTGFKDHRGRDQVVTVRYNRAFGLAQASRHLLALEGMAVTDDPNRRSVSAHNIIMAADVFRRTNDQVAVSTLSIGKPGVAFEPWRPEITNGQTYDLVKEQKADLWDGNFSSIAQAEANAIDYMVHEHPELQGQDIEAIRIAPSLDTSTASAGVEALLGTDVNLRRIALLDPVGLSAQQGFKRLLEFLSVDGKPYLAANHPLHQALLESNLAWLLRSAHSPANLLYGLRGISLGGATNDLLKARELLAENDVSLRLYAAEQSEFDTLPGVKNAFDALVEAKGKELDVKYIRLAGGHALTMATGTYAKVIEDYALAA